MTALWELEQRILAQREKLSEIAAKEGRTEAELDTSVQRALALERQIAAAPIGSAQDAGVKLRSVARLLDTLGDEMRGDADSREIIEDVLAWLEGRDPPAA